MNASAPPTLPHRSAAHPRAARSLKVVVLGGRAAGQATVPTDDTRGGPWRAMGAAHAGPDACVPAGPQHEPARAGRVPVRLYGMPVAHRSWFLWDSLARGAVAALVLADASRLSDSFPAIDYAEARRVRYLVAVTGAWSTELADVRRALAVGADVPVLLTTPPSGHRAWPADALLRALIRHVTVRHSSRIPAA